MRVPEKRRYTAPLRPCRTWAQV